MIKVWIPFRISVLPKKATALCAAALSVVFPEKSEQTSDEKPELSERSDKVAFHLFRGRADSLSACGNHDKVSCSETALRQDAAISRPHYSLTAVSRYGVAELCRCREADAVEVLLLRVLFFQLRRLVVTQDINRYGFTGEPHSLGICLDKKVVFFYRKLFHKNNPSPGHDNRLRKSGRGRLSVGKSCSSLGASSLEHLSSVGSAHSLHKAVLLGSLKLFRLICSYHFQSLLFFGIIMTLTYIIHGFKGGVKGEGKFF